ncbi:MAG: hypothetical protein WBW76_12780 [Candidatus Cybelea sp.]
MERSSLACRVLGLSVLAILAACNGSGSAITPITSVQAESTQSSTPATFTPGHLYVAQGADIASKVYRFPLQSDGLPSKLPDGELTLGFRYPGGIAIGPDGDLYVSDSGTAYACRNERTCFVEVFAPGASHRAAPIRKLYVPQQPQYIAVDQRGYLDVSTLEHGGGVTNVYRPNASGNDQPINEITTRAVNALGASRGIAYIQLISLGVGIEAVQERPGSEQPEYYRYGYNYSANGVATDRGRLYAQFFYRHHNKFFLATAIYRIGHPGNPERIIVGRGCEEGLNSGALGYGLAVYKKYLYEGCVGLGGAAGGVLVYDNRRHGWREPVLQLPGGDVGVAIGP